jgi:hypothetical protein
MQQQTSPVKTGASHSLKNGDSPPSPSSMIQPQPATTVESDA